MVVIERLPMNYAARIPDMPDCVATGATHKGVQGETRGAIGFHNEIVWEHGEPMRTPQGMAAGIEFTAVAP